MPQMCIDILSGIQDPSQSRGREYTVRNIRTLPLLLSGVLCLAIALFSMWVWKADGLMSRDSRPLLLIYRYPGFERPIKQGLVVAVWANGNFVTAQSDSSIGQSYESGVLDGSQMDRLRVILEEHGIERLAAKKQPLVQDAPVNLLCWRTDQLYRVAESMPPASGQQPIVSQTVRAVRELLSSLTTIKSGNINVPNKWLK